jgi:hypothetical protein
MGLFDFLRPLKTGKKIAELEMALIGKHVFTNLANKEQKEQIIALVNRRLREGGINDRTIDDLDDRVRYLFIALAVQELSIDYRLLKDFQFQITNPFLIKTYDETLWATASEVLQKNYGIKVNI